MRAGVSADSSGLHDNSAGLFASKPPNIHTD